jgi:hypothetical protein
LKEIRSSGEIQFKKFVQGIDLRAKVKVMQKCIFFVTNINKSSIQPGHNLFNPAKINVSYCKTIVTLFLFNSTRSLSSRSAIFTSEGPASIISSLFKTPVI